MSRERQAIDNLQGRILCGIIIDGKIIRLWSVTIYADHTLNVRYFFRFFHFLHQTCDGERFFIFFNDNIRECSRGVSV